MKHIRYAAAAALAACAWGAQAQAFTLSSPDIAAGVPMPVQFTANVLGCKGGNVSPALRWDNPPEGTKSFALMVHDPDAPTGGAGVWHWVVINIPADARAIEQGASTADGTRLPPGSRQIGNDYAGFTNGSPAWGGPCPPLGHAAHQYNFTLYALKVDKLNLPPAATASHAGFVVNLNALGRATLSVPYGR